MAALIEAPSLRDRATVFEDRADAGRRLGEWLKQYRGTDSIVLAVPAGGVPVGAAIAQSLNVPLDLVMVRKIQVPGNTEAGFGAMDPDGEVLLNERFLRELGLSDASVQAQQEKTRAVIEQRNRDFRGGRPFPDVAEKTVIIVDDGLASGSTMRSAVRFVRRRKPARIVAAVPTGHLSAVETLLPEVDELVCLNVRSGRWFAVADAYRKWYDLPDREVLSLLRDQQEAKP